MQSDESGFVLRLRSLRVMLPGSSDWLTVARDEPSSDNAGAYVHVSRAMLIQATIGTELELKVRWVPAPADDDEDDDE